jgi:hypothetical protein
MTIPLTPEMLEAAYDYLRTTPPFNKWKLPPGAHLTFRVAKTRKMFGSYQRDGDHHIITASAGKIGQTMTLLRLLSHEMNHMHLEILGLDSRGGPDTHTIRFRKDAALICKVHGFDPKEFF